MSINIDISIRTYDKLYQNNGLKNNYFPSYPRIAVGNLESNPVGRMM